MSDELDNLIHNAFNEFDAAERSSHLPVPGAGAVRHKVAFRRKARFTAFSVVGALLIAVPITTYAANPRGNNSPPDVVGTLAPSTTASPTPSATPSAEPVQPADVRNTTLTLPAFPEFEDNCEAKGKKKFVNGKVTIKENVALTIGELQPIMADLDGVAGDELLTTIRCDTDGSVHPTQLLALKVAPDGALTPLGYVLPNNLATSYTSEPITVEDGIVRLVAYGGYQTNGQGPCDRQARGYAFRNGAFRQVEGPTEFRTPSQNYHEIDFRNVGLYLGRNPAKGGADNVGTTRLYCVTMVDGVGQADVYNDNEDESKGKSRYTVTIGPVSFVDARDGEVTFALLTLRSPTGETSQTLQSFQHEGDYPSGEEVLRSGVDGIRSIEKAEVSGANVKVTVTTSSGKQVLTYRPSTSANWERIGS